ncbi:hypothetical protein [Pseudonocardia sp. GCM10023141]|uniref:hypothetical protein n=1 Tax=Pseudonocardia sp. GCM10023141 TaxID=3252653 RepID=UPI003617D485
MDWLLVRSDTGQRKWLQGSESEARAAGLPADAVRPPERITARCGSFYGPETDQCTGPGSWQVPTPAFLAGLPRDPAQLLARLERDVPDNIRGNAELLVYATDLLRTGLVPADLRSALYLALAHVGGVTVTAGAVNLDGRSGVALGIDVRSSRQEIIVDPATGAFIGEREVALRGDRSKPAGTVLGYTSVRSGVVDQLGATPVG